MSKNENWSHNGSAEGFGALVPGPSYERVHNNETDEDHEVWVDPFQEVGEAIEKGQFRKKK